jgi:pilus assembly protein CpaC
VSEVGVGTIAATGIAFFDENRSLIGTIDVEVTLDTAQLQRTIRQSVPNADISVSSANGRLILSGTVADATAAEQALQIAEQFADDEAIVNSIRITSSQQVQLNVRFVEINRAVGAELGSSIGAVYNAGGTRVSFNSSPGLSGTSPAGSIIGGLVTGGLSID